MIENEENAVSHLEEAEGEIVVSPEELIPTVDELTSLIEEKRYAELRKKLADIPAADIAELFDSLKEEYYSRFFRLLPKESASEVFVLVDSDTKEHIIAAFTDVELASMLNELYLDDTVDIIEEMPANVVKRILRNSTSENRSIINQLLRYPKDSAGTIMTTEYVRFVGTMTVERALAHIRKVAIDKETIYTCYVTDKERHLLGIVTAKQLLISPLETTLEEIMEEAVIFVNTTDDKELVAKKIDKYGFLALPVVDNEHRLVGIVTVDDAIDVINEETEEDFAKMAAITPTETPYLKTSVLGIFKARIPWLLLLMVSATFSSTILNRFESALPAVLILFVPMLMDTGGNSGGQSSVTIIRGISVGELKMSDILRIFWKEVSVGIACGVTLGAVAFGKVILVDRLIMNNPEVTFSVAAIVAVTLALTVIMAKIIGSSLPVLAKRLGFDPAVMASPFITTIVDALALLLYFSVSASFLGL